MTFHEFFRELWGYDPFPWQEEVAARAVEGDWPRHIGVPTAAGKTALIDVAVYALAMRAPGAGRRIFFVVDRRVIVDEAATRAADIAKKLADAPAGSALAIVAQSLRDLGGLAPLETAILRGGMARDDSWTDSPLQAAVICSTVDQIGSSLLFRAYGASEYARPIRAGLAAHDSVILLDEAHTSRAFAQTLKLIEKFRKWADEPIETPFRVVEMSATPGGHALRESSRDMEDQTLKRRWEASKRARLATIEPAEGEEAAKGGFTALIAALAREARAVRDQRGAKVIGVIANRVRTAREVHELLKQEEGCDAILLIGRSRPYDRDRIWGEWNESIRLGRKGQERPIFVVATQCIEVGANLDFDALVTEVASIDALEQRFGRLDRDGRQAEALGATHAVIVAQKDQVAKKFEDVLYGGAMAATWSWLLGNVTTETRLEELPADGKKKPKTRKVKEQFVEMGVRVLRAALDATPERSSLATPAGSSPVLLPAHVDLLSQTCPEPEISPEPAVYLHGPESGPADVQVIWRADLDGDPEEWPDLVATCPPASPEMLELPLYAVKQWLSEETTGDLADVEGGAAASGKTKGATRPVLWWRGPEESQPLKKADQIRPGMTIVVPYHYGGCDAWGWNPEYKGDVKDVGDAVKLAMDRPILRLHARLADQWNYAEIATSLRKAGSEREETLEQAYRTGATGWVAETLQELTGGRWIPAADGESYTAIVSRTVFDQSDGRSAYGREVRLDEHMKNCARVAAQFAEALPERLRRTVERAAATHDLGKADPRFQAWLRGGNPVRPDELIAKSSRNGQNRAAIKRARELSGYPKGGRHELTSTALLLARGGGAEDLDGDLLLHLVASHHGRCRPFAPVVADDEPVAVTHAGLSVSSKHELEGVGSGVSERFWRLTKKYGWYGLAYLETLVRLADQRQSEAERDAGKAAHA